MSSATSIEWADVVWNPTVGCSRVSAGCQNCYAERVAHRGLDPAHRGLTVAGARGPRWTGEVRLLEERLEDPLRWRKPRRIFVNSMSDLFHEAVPFDFVEAVASTIARAERHTFLVLTKRPERLRAYCEWACEKGVMQIDLPNVHLGVSVEDQATADERIPLLLQTPAALRWVSAEPLLGPVNLAHLDADAAGSRDLCQVDALTGRQTDMGRPCPDVPRLDWIVVGGESGPGARPCDVAWIRNVVQQARLAKVPAFVKQLGAWPKLGRYTGLGVDRLRDRKGADPAEWPEDLRVRELPGVKA